MQIDKEYRGHKQWTDGSRQHIHAKDVETKQDAIRYMRDHLHYFERTDLDFDEQEIEDYGDQFIITLRDAHEVQRIRAERNLRQENQRRMYREQIESDC